MFPKLVKVGSMIPLRLRSPRHHAAIFVFSASTHRASIPPYVGILAWQPPRPPALPIYFFSKFSFPCGNILSLKSAFIIEGLSVLEEQVSPEHLKNQTYDEIKSHHYIISFDPKDRDECGLTGEQAQQLGLEYCKKNFPGHQALVCTHTDGHNGSGNIHVHIVINSQRKNDVERQNFMECNCDSRAGNKHHLTNDYLVYLKQSLMDLCLRENLHQVDLLTKTERKVTEKEYHAKRSGQKN